MQKHMSKSEVRCASLLNNILDENIKVNNILEKINAFEDSVSITCMTFLKVRKPNANIIFIRELAY